MTATGSGYRAVLFDFGGTLFSYLPFRERFGDLLVRTAADHGVDLGVGEATRAFRSSSAEVQQRYLNRTSYLHRDLFGDLGVAFVGQFGVPPREDLRERFYRGQTEVARPLIRARDEAVEVLESLRSLELHLGIVSNIDDDQFAELWALCELDSWFDAITTSESAGSCKPDRGIFDLAMSRAGVERPEQVVFVGDSLHHDVAGASALGMTTVLIQEFGGELAESSPQPTLVANDLRALLPLLGVGSS